MLPARNYSNRVALIDDIFDSFLKSSRQELSSYYYDEENKEHVIHVEAPGFKKDDVEIDVDSKGIYLKGEIKDEKTKGRISRSTFNYQMNMYGIDSKSIEATLEDGILLVKFKTEKEKTLKRIEIK